MIKGSTDKNQRKEDRSQKDKVRIYSPNHFLLREAKRRPRRGNHDGEDVPATRRRERDSRQQSRGRSRGWSRGRTPHWRSGRARYRGYQRTRHRSFRRSRHGSLGRTHTRPPITSKSSRLKVKTKKRNSMQQEYKNNSPPHDEGYFIILLSLNQGNQSTC